jgi:uncharacterized membrane protein YfcA
MMGLDDIPARLQGPELVAALLGLGFVVGILTGLFGVGGGFMVTPLLQLLFGLPWSLAVGSSLGFTIGTGASGAAMHARSGNFEPRSMLGVGGMGVLGAIIGVRLHHFLAAELGAEPYDLTMSGLYIVLLGGTAWIISRRQLPTDKGTSLLQRLGGRPRINLPRADITDISLPGLLGVGLAVGTLSGLMGVGGGVLLVPLLILVVGLSPHQAVGTSLGAIIFMSASGAIGYAIDGQVSLWVVMSLLVGSTLGIQIGGAISRRLGGKALRQWFALLVLAVTLWLLADFLRELLT